MIAARSFLGPKHGLGHVDERKVEAAEAGIVHEPEQGHVHVSRIDAVHRRQREASSVIACRNGQNSLCRG